jgi:hypothetical protein
MMIAETRTNTHKPMEQLNDDTVLLYAIKAYDKLNYIKSEFEEDFKTFRYVKRLLQRYRGSGELRENLILNHLNLIYNLFGIEAGTRLLFYKIDEADYGSLKTFLLFLNVMPNVIRGINGKDINSSNIAIDKNIANVLRNI